MEAVKLKRASGIKTPCLNTVYSRMRRGMTADEAMQPIVNISKAAREAGLNVNTVYYRVTHGMTLQQALRCRVVSRANGRSYHARFKCADRADSAGGAGSL